MNQQHTPHFRYIHAKYVINVKPPTCGPVLLDERHTVHTGFKKNNNYNNENMLNKQQKLCNNSELNAWWAIGKNSHEISQCVKCMGGWGGGGRRRWGGGEAKYGEFGASIASFKTWLQ